MKYLFFDIECANCFNGRCKICEFGYVETDEKFNEIASDEYIINPDAPFDRYVMKKLLAYPKELYLSKSKYPTYFPQIKALFENEEITIFGHTVDADAKYLNDEAKRYNLPFFNYTFYDVKEIYSAYANSKKGVSLEKIGDILGSKNRGHAHRAIDDARSTMLAAKKMCETLETDLMQLTLLCERCVGQTKDGVITTVAKVEAEQRRKLSEKAGLLDKNIIHGKNRIKFLKFLENVKAQGDIVKSELNGKTLSITINYEQGHYKEMLSIIQLLKNRDCTYKLKASDCDYFVEKAELEENGEERSCSRLRYVKEAIAKGKKIKIITFKQLLELINTTEEELTKMPVPDVKYFLKKEKEEQTSLKFSTKENTGNSIGDLIGEQLQCLKNT